MTHFFVIMLKLPYASLRAVNIQAETQGDIRSVKFDMQGPLSVRRTENRPPWALFGDNNGDYRASTLFPGNYTLTATPYLLPAAVGEKGKAKEIQFEVVGSDASVADNPFLIQIFPNPTTGVTTLSIPNDWNEDTRLKLMDRVGKVVWKTNVSSSQRLKKLELSHLANGVYLLQLINGEHMETKRIVIAR